MKFYNLQNIIRVKKSRRIKWVGHVARMGEMRNLYLIFVGEPEGKRPFGRLRRREENNIKMHLRIIRWEGVDWIHLSQDRDQWWAVVNRVMGLLFP